MSASRLLEIEVERSILLRKLNALGAEKHALLLEKHGITIGMLVIDKKGSVYKVTGARYLDGYGTPWLLGYRRLKNNSFGKLIKTIYEGWKRVEDKQ